MPPVADLYHLTRYTYPEPVTLGPQVVRLRPSPYCRTLILDYSLTASPSDHYVNWLADPGGNWLARFVFTQPVQELVFEVRLAADLEPVNPFDFFVDGYAETWPFDYSGDLRTELAAFLGSGPAPAPLQAFLSDLQGHTHNTVELLTGLNRRVFEAVGYELREEPGVHDPAYTLERQTGSCRDSAWLLVAALRHLGFGARFVSGYLVQPPDESGELSTVASELHAWTEAYLPGAGWIGLDPTLGALCAEGHIPLAATAHHQSAAPLTGSFSGTSVELSHEIRVEMRG